MSDNWIFKTSCAPGFARVLIEDSYLINIIGTKILNDYLTIGWQYVPKAAPLLSLVGNYVIIYFMVVKVLVYETCCVGAWNNYLLSLFDCLLLLVGSWNIVEAYLCKLQIVTECLIGMMVSLQYFVSNSF